MAATRSRIATWLEQTRSDARMLIAGLRGVNPNPLVARPARTHDVHRPSATARSARIFRVAELTRPTADAVSVVLEDPAGAPIEFLPGQFFTLLVDVDGVTLRRAYSAASRCTDSTRVRLAIKRVGGGRVSNHLNDNLQPGQLVRALGPSGDFTYTPDAAASRHVVLIAGGSGITPMMSIAASALDVEPSSHVTLIYGNRSRGDIIFATELEALAERYPERFTLRHVLSEPPAGWTGGIGMLEPAVLAGELDGSEASSPAPRTYYVCGPEPMMVGARETLLERGVAAADIHEERFTQPHLRGGAVVANTVSQPVRVSAGGRDHDVTVQPGETILDAGLAAGVPMKYSCAMGGCGACKVKLRDGTVESEEPNCLTTAERDAGYVLACVSRPTSAAAVELED